MEIAKIDSSILVEEFLSGNENTIEAYRQDLESFKKFLGFNSIEELSENFIKLESSQANLVAVKFKKNLI